MKYFCHRLCSVLTNHLYSQFQPCRAYPGVTDRCSLLWTLCSNWNVLCMGDIYIPVAQVSRRTGLLEAGRQGAPEVTASSPDSRGLRQTQQKDWATASVAVMVLRVMLWKLWGPATQSKVLSVQEVRAVLRGLSHWRWLTQISFKASKFIAVHFLVALTMEIVQIFILNSIAFERPQSFWYLLQSFMKIYMKLVLFLKFKHYDIQRDYIMLLEEKIFSGSHRAQSVLIKLVF